MTRRADPEVLKRSSSLNARVHTLLDGYSLSQTEGVPSELDHLAEEYAAISSAVGELSEAAHATTLSRSLTILATACRWVQAIVSAEVDASRFINAANAQARILSAELSSDLSRGSATREAFVSWLEHLCRIDDVTSMVHVVSIFAQIPLPVFYFVSEDPYAGIKRLREAALTGRRESTADDSDTDQDKGDATARVIRVMFSVDGAAWATPQAIRSMVQHDVEARVQLLDWPRSMEWLELDFISTQDPQLYIAPNYRWTRREVELNVAKRGGLLFKFAQSHQSGPMVLTTRARFLASDNVRMLLATVIGHADLQVRALDQSSYPVLTRYPMIDIQIPKLLEEVRGALPELSASDFDDFMNCLVMLGRYAGMVQQTGVFKGKDVDEKRDFQQHLLQHLRMHLGPDIREEETLAGGRLDLKFRNVVIELKVEYSLKDRVKLRTKYVRQPAQYSASGIPVSVVCILDMVEKAQPPSNVANNITLETPALHGYETDTPQYPSKVAVVIIDGNLRSPSAYS